MDGPEPLESLPGGNRLEKRGCMRPFLCCVVLAGIGSLSPAMAAPPSRIGPGVREGFLAGESVRVLIYLSIPGAADASPAATRERVSMAQGVVLQELGPGRFVVQHRFENIPALAGEVTLAGLERLAALPAVVRVDLDAGGSANLAQAVPLTNTNDVHALGLSGQGVTVAVLDSGIDTNHADLADDLVGEACFCSGSGGCCPGGGATQFGAGAAEDDNGHGSNVTGIVTSKGTVAPLGTAPDASIVAIKVLASNGSFCCSSDVIAGLDWILSNRPDVDVVNMSLGTNDRFSGDCDNVFSYTMAYAAAINALRANGVLSFVSTGNNGSLFQMQAPACIANAISVGAVWDANVGSRSVFCVEATTAADKITCFTNRNNRTDLFAPGAPTTSAYNNGGTSTFYGTSQASPHCAGCAADLLEAFPGLDPALLEDALESTGVTLNDAGTGLSFPRVDCLAALDVLACRDDDSDGFAVSDLCSLGGPQDCADDDPVRFPGNPEVCDGLDNDCDGQIPESELVPPAVVEGLGLSNEVSWGTALLADHYDLIRGNLQGLAASGGDFSLATTGCEANDHAATNFPLPADPALGQVVWVLVRAGDCAGPGSYDSTGAAQVGLRDVGIAVSGVACAD